MKKYKTKLNNTIRLSRHEQVCLIRLRFERYFSHHRDPWEYFSVIIIIREDMLLVMWAGFWMISFKENVWYGSLYLDTKREPKFLKSSDWLSLRINISFSRRLILKSPRK